MAHYYYEIYLERWKDMALRNLNNLSFKYDKELIPASAREMDESVEYPCNS